MKIPLKNKEEISRLSDEDLIEYQNDLAFNYSGNEIEFTPIISCVKSEISKRELRKSKEQLVTQNDAINTLISKFDKIISLLTYFAKKPTESLFFAIVFAVITGTLINVFTPLLTRFTNWLLSFFSLNT